jgi:CHAT domain-containing protein/Tfp pilus assembly protein PilF
VNGVGVGLDMASYRRTWIEGRHMKTVMRLAFVITVGLLGHTAIQAQDGDDPEDAVAFRRGEALRLQGKPKEALEEFRKGLKIVTEREGADSLNASHMLNGMGMVYADLGEYAKAAEMYQRSLAITEAKLGKDDTTVAIDLNNLASLFKSMGQFAKAESLFRRSLAIREAKLGKDDRQVGQSFHNLAGLYEKMGRYTQAEAMYHRGIEIFGAKLGKDHPQFAESLISLADLEKEMGQYGKADALYQRGLQILEAKYGKDHPRLGIALNNQANFYSSLGQYLKAEALFRRTLTIYEARFGKDNLFVAQTLSNLAHKYAKDDKEALYRRILGIKEKQLGQDHPSVAHTLRKLADYYVGEREYAKAEPLYRRSLQIQESKVGKEHPDFAAALHSLGDLAFAQGQFGEAEEPYRRSLKILESARGKDHPDLAEYLVDLALVDALADRWDKAAEGMDRARRIDRRHASRSLPLLGELGQLDFLKHIQQDRYYIALTLAVARRADADVRDRSAEWVLNGKAVTLESLAQRALIARGGEPVDAETWTSLTQVRKAIPEGSILVEFARYDPFDLKTFGRAEARKAAHYAAWIIPPNGKGAVQILDLGEAEKIDTAIVDARKALQGASTLIRTDGEAAAEKVVKKALQDVATLVLQPLQEHLDGSEHWLISPDASLWLLPWGALPIKDDAYAFEKHTIQLLASGRDLVRPANASKPGRPIVLADPDFDLEPKTARSVAVELLGSEPTRSVVNSHAFPLQFPAVARLPGTAAEAKAIEPKLGTYAGDEAWVYKGKNALEVVAKAIERPRVLVFSTHGFFLGDQVVATADTRAVGLTNDGKPLENPLRRCGLLLAGCNRRTEASETDEDGILTGEEIVGCDLRGTELVVLSACETGLGQVNNGEGVAGLRQAFQLAGARSVVATLWQVPDRDTALLMIDFFDNLAKKQAKAEALRNAQLARIKARRDRNGAAHPFFWAAFTITGQ